MFLFLILFFVTVSGDYSYNYGCKNINIDHKTELTKINGTWFVLAKSNSIEFEFGCKDLVYQFYLEEFNYLVGIECYNIFLQRHISATGLMWVDQIDSHFAISYVKNNKGWNRHYRKPLDIIFANNNFMVTVECLLTPDQHFSDKTIFNCEEKRECDTRGEWFEWCNKECPNKVVAKTPLSKTQSTGIRIMSRTKMPLNLDEIKNVLSQYGFTPSDLSMVD